MKKTASIEIKFTNSSSQQTTHFRSTPQRPPSSSRPPTLLPTPLIQQRLLHHIIRIIMINFLNEMESSLTLNGSASTTTAAAAAVGAAATAGAVPTSGIIVDTEADASERSTGLLGLEDPGTTTYSYASRRRRSAKRVDIAQSTMPVLSARSNRVRLS
eukprot:CCRYP_018985-RA/>CCRYP_018985-RA protein AED:0.18 eAED:0.35 QI:0/0/0.5/1/0/0/2/572/157